MEGNCQFCSHPFNFSNPKIDLFCGHSVCKECIFSKLIAGLTRQNNFNAPIPPPPVPNDGFGNMPTPPPPLPYGGPVPAPPVPFDGHNSAPFPPPFPPTGGFDNFPILPPAQANPHSHAQIPYPGFCVPGFPIPGRSMITPPYILPINFKANGEFLAEATNAIFTVKLMKINYDKVPVLALEKTSFPQNRMVNDCFLPQDLFGIAEPKSTRWNNYQFSLGRYQPDDHSGEILVVTVVIDDHPDRKRTPLEEPIKPENFVGNNELQAYNSRTFKFRETYFSGRERRVITFS